MTKNEIVDRRERWSLPPRPEWAARLIELGGLVDTRHIVPLDEDSLLSAARDATGLSDFGDADGWRTHFRVLLNSLEHEARLHFVGRILTRADLLIYLGSRLMVTDEYKRHPEIENEVISEPVFILGFGRSGTTILQETLAQDPEFRSVRRWEAYFPSPPPEEATYETDPRIARAQAHVEFLHAISPEWRTMHAWGGDLPVEDIEFTYACFCSEVWETAMTVPSVGAHFAKVGPAYHLAWHKRILKLLQWKFRRPHWMLKNPTHMPRIPELIAAYPDAKIILPHRDPIKSADSVINVGGTIFSWRTEVEFKDMPESEWLQIDQRVKMWDDVIGWIEDGTLREGYYANSLYADLMTDPLTAIEGVYRDLRLELTPEARRRMKTFLDARHAGSHGNTSKYSKTRAEDPIAIEERRRYKRYQEYFGVPDEP